MIVGVGEGVGVGVGVCVGFGVDVGSGVDVGVGEGVIVRVGVRVGNCIIVRFCPVLEGVKVGIASERVAFVPELSTDAANKLVQPVVSSSATNNKRE